MFLKKICIFLAVVFAAVDIFLLSMYFEAKNSAKNISDKMIEDTVSYFRTSGVKIDESIISEVVPQNKIYTFSYANVDIGDRVAENIVKALNISATSVNPVETPDGTSYSINADNSVAASFRVYSDSFKFEYVSGDFDKSIHSVPSNAFENDNIILDKNQDSALYAFFSGLTLSEKPKYTVTGSYVSQGGLCVSVRQNISDKCAVSDMYANVLVDGDKVLYAEGKMIFAQIKKSYSEQLYDGVNALMRIDLTDVSQFLSENIVYMYRYSGNGVYYLIPMWKIEYIDLSGVKKTQYVDAIKT